MRVHLRLHAATVALLFSSAYTTAALAVADSEAGHGFLSIFGRAVDPASSYCSSLIALTDITTTSTSTLPTKTFTTKSTLPPCTSTVSLASSYVTYSSGSTKLGTTFTKTIAPTTTTTTIAATSTITPTVTSTFNVTVTQPNSAGSFKVRRQVSTFNPSTGVPASTTALAQTTKLAAASTVACSVSGVPSQFQAGVCAVLSNSCSTFVVPKTIVRSTTFLPSTTITSIVSSPCANVTLSVTTLTTNVVYTITKSNSTKTVSATLAIITSTNFIATTTASSASVTTITSTITIAATSVTSQVSMTSSTTLPVTTITDSGTSVTATATTSNTTPSTTAPSTITTITTSTTTAVTTPTTDSGISVIATDITTITTPSSSSSTTTTTSTSTIVTTSTTTTVTTPSTSIILPPDTNVTSSAECHTVHYASNGQPFFIQCGWNYLGTDNILQGYNGIASIDACVEKCAGWGANCQNTVYYPNGDCYLLQNTMHAGFPDTTGIIVSARIIGNTTCGDRWVAPNGAMYVPQCNFAWNLNGNPYILKTQTGVPSIQACMQACIKYAGEICHYLNWYPDGSCVMLSEAWYGGGYNAGSYGGQKYSDAP